MLYFLNVYDNTKHGTPGAKFTGIFHYGGESYEHDADTIDELKKICEESLIEMIIKDRLNSEPIINFTNSIDEDYDTFGMDMVDFKIVIDIDPTKELMLRCTETTRRNVTLPVWLELLAKESQVNFSQTLQDALIEKLGIRDSALADCKITRSNNKTANKSNGFTPGTKFILQMMEED